MRSDERWVADQVRLRTLIKEDPEFRKFFSQVPVIMPKPLESARPWRVYIQREEGGRWSRGDLHTYQAAYSWLKPRLSEVHDAAIHCKVRRFDPPILARGKQNFWLPMPEGHRWCPYCRRATVFTNFSNHPAIPFKVSYEDKRCTTCGASEPTMKRYKTPLHWPAPLVQLSK